jgi:hypothetical protein
VVIPISLHFLEMPHMKYLTIALSALLLLPSHAIAGVNDIEKMRQLSTGNFRVTCLNGSVETVTAAKIIQNNVCNPPIPTPTPTPTPAPTTTTTLGLICSGDNFFNRYNVTRISDGYKFGSTESNRQMPLEKCKQAIANSRQGLICSGDHFFDRYNVTRISDGYKFGSTEPGRQLTFDQCLDVIRDMR